MPCVKRMVDLTLESLDSELHSPCYNRVSFEIQFYLLPELFGIQEVKQFGN